MCSVGTGGGEAAQLGYNKEGLEPAWVCAPACVLATVLLLVTRSVTAAAILDVDLGSNIAATCTDTAQG